MGRGGSLTRRIREVEPELDAPAATDPDPELMFGDTQPRIIRRGSEYWIRRPGAAAVKIGANFEDAQRALRELRSKRRRGAKHAVYLIEGSPGFLKIGVAASPALRLQSIQTSCPHDLRLAHVAWFESRALAECMEQQLLARFAKIRARGEWVQDVPEVREALAELAAT